jgi:hypothetical protein
MELLYSNILPVGLEENQKTIQDCLHRLTRAHSPLSCAMDK